MSQKLLLVAGTLLAMYACGSTEEGNTTETNAPAAVTTTPSATVPIVTPDTSTASLLTPPPTAAVPVAPTPKLNPPHGQPGHRCDIEVGQPLPAAGTTVVATQPSAQPVQPIMQNPQPVMMNPPANANILPGAPKGKVNTPHGEPGHRCDIAVGAPLN